MDRAVISVENIAKGFGKSVIFENCSVSIEAGSVFGLVGLNGSGKTTFIRLLLGLLKPGRGAISVLGYDPWEHAPSYYKMLGVMLDHDGFTGNLNIAENISLFAEAKGMAAPLVRAYVEERWKDTFLYDEFFGGKKKVKHLSRGQKMQCAICRAFLSRPRVCFLDEPTVALDVDAIDHFYSLVNQARAGGATLLISSHQLSAVEDLCDTVGVLDRGNISIVKSPVPGGGAVPWMVRCEDETRFGGIIESVCGLPAVFTGGAWRFRVREPATAIPEIVRRLASNGCGIIEVREDAGSLKDRIKNSGAGPEGGL